MVLLKLCYSCGKKTQKIISGLCENCLKVDIPVVKELKEMNFKICNQTKKLYYKNKYFEEEEFKTLLPNFIKKNIILNDPYQLNEITIPFFEVDGHILIFDIEIDYDLKK